MDEASETESPVFFSWDRKSLLLSWDALLCECVSPSDWQEIRSAWRQHSDLCTRTSERRRHGSKLCLIALKEEMSRSVANAGRWLMQACSQHSADHFLFVIQSDADRSAMDETTVSVWFFLWGRSDLYFMVSQQLHNDFQLLSEGNSICSGSPPENGVKHIFTPSAKIRNISATRLTNSGQDTDKVWF